MESKIYRSCCRCFAVCLLLCVLYSPISLYAQDPNFHIYLLFGQSNMEGMGSIEAQDRVTNNRVKVLQDQTCSNLGRTYGQWYTATPPLNRCWSGLGPGDWFGKAMADGTSSNTTIGLVVTAVGGCDILFFQKGAPLGKASALGGGPADIPTQFTGGYAWMLDLAQKAKTAGVIKGILFHQGETNTGDSNWKYKVQGIINDLKKDLGIGDVPFLAGELLYQQYNSCCSRHNSEINLLPGIIPNSYVISANNLPGKDEAHFTSASYRELGKRYAQKMLSLSNNQCSATTLVPSVKVASESWTSVTEVTIAPQTQVMLGPQPITGGSWSWTGCNTSGNMREQTTAPTTSCSATATYTNDCGTKSVITFKINVNRGANCCGSSASNGYTYCCTDSDPDGDGWGWENNASCIVPGSAADPQQCGKVTQTLEQELGDAIELFPSPCQSTLDIIWPNKALGDYKYSILALDGSIMNSSTPQEIHSTSINVSTLKAGMYFLKLNSMHEERILKFIKE